MYAILSQCTSQICNGGTQPYTILSFLPEEIELSFSFRSPKIGQESPDLMTRLVVRICVPGIWQTGPEPDSGQD